MQIKELRISNLVGFKNRTDFYGEIIEINISGGVVINRYFDDNTDDSQPESLEDLTPIDIDVQWLMTLGFNSAFGSNLNGLWKYNIKINNSGYTVRLMHGHEIGLFKNGNLIRFVKYIHQLQNLIYDLEEFDLFKNHAKFVTLDWEYRRIAI